MLSLLGSALGFFGAGLPNIMKFFQDKSDKKHELALMKEQAAIEANRAIQVAKIHKDTKVDLAKIDLSKTQSTIDHEAEIALYKAIREQNEALNARDKTTGDKFLDRLRGSVRPLITYWWMLVFTGVEIALTIYVFNSGMTIPEGVALIWKPETEAIFASIISFWFGSRHLNSKKT